jgi:hypothetical protein
VKQRLLVMNGQCAMQQKDQGQWRNAKVKKARGVKPGIYNIYTANKADKTKEYSGVILYADKTTVYQQVGKGQYIAHDRADFAKLPETGETKSISYSADGKAVVSEAALGQKQMHHQLACPLHTSHTP